MARRSRRSSSAQARKPGRPGCCRPRNALPSTTFHHERGDDRSDAYDLVRAWNIVAAKDVDVINLSLAGPDNEVLRRAVAAIIAAQDLMMVAAAGNDGFSAYTIYPGRRSRRDRGDGRRPPVAT